MLLMGTLSPSTRPVKVLHMQGADRENMKNKKYISMNNFPV